MQADASLFSNLYIVAQERDVDMDIFFKHENSRSPPSLSEDGNLRIGKKSDLLKCLETQRATTSDAIDTSNLGSENLFDSSTEPIGSISLPNAFGCTILDGAAVVHMLPTAGVATFEEYANEVFILYIYKPVASKIDQS